MFSLRDFKVIIRDLGLLLIIIAATMMIPIFVGIYYSEWASIQNFLIGAAISASIGSAFFFLTKGSIEMGLKHAIALIVLFWPVASFFSAIPIYLSAENVVPSMSFLDAYFEGMSGWTTTGLTTIGFTADTFPHCINIWRGMMQFMGGLGIILIGIAVLAQARTGSESISLVASELSPGERIRPGIWSTAKSIIFLFIMFLLICSIILMIAGMNSFDAVFHAMTGLGTGGFSTYPDSIAHWNSNFVELATIIVMIIGSTNFAVHLTVLSGNYREIFKNIEMRSFIFFLSIFVILGAIWLWSSASLPSLANGNNGASLNESMYHIVSGMTTTGWTIIPGGTLVGTYPMIFLFIVVISFIIGGNSISTAGGLRQVRVALIGKSIWWHIKKTLLPSTVVFPRSYHHIVKKTVTDSRMTDIYVFVSVYLLMLLISTIVIMSYGYDLTLSFFESSSALTSAGMSFGVTSLTAAAGVKIMLIINMWLGRIEIIPVLLFIASFSKKFK